MRYYLPIILATGLLLLGCKNENTQQNSERVTETTKPPAKALQEEEIQLPSVSQEFITDLFSRCDYIDFVFYELPFSMSFDNPNAIQTTMTWISTSVPVLTKNCKPLGRMVYQSKGEIIVEAEMIVSEANECGHVVWIVDGKRTFANRYNLNGKNYMLGIIKQGQQKQK